MLQIDTLLHPLLLSCLSAASPGNGMLLLLLLLLPRPRCADAWLPAAATQVPGTAKAIHLRPADRDVRQQPCVPAAGLTGHLLPPHCGRPVAEMLRQGESPP